ncbi:hypothetical protein ACFQI7_14585 [Paenibacillus allorhizosphaerae]|uniref:Lamin tail domain-containing protein n=1 Tax=Paenibacillus allorhizosphaerae TaxID=2849866 RepID=A0ABM8VD92_9BACL|nr:hypothetical protein [Paenibacillus allorhizosphaerae]CAG7626902.1 hypothetical protein PAECIP111802_01298 [Paenibacillus allorhizosphaerae]
MSSMLRNKNVYLKALTIVVLSFAFAFSSAFAAGVPPLVITQIVPDTDNVDLGGTAGDGYELVEMYNASGKEFKTKGYHIIYAYNDDISDAKNQIWSLGDKTIPAGGFLYVWVKQEKNGVSLADFAKYWKIKEDQVVSVKSDGMANGSRRVLFVATPDKKEVSRAPYNDKEVSVEVNKSFVYGYNADGSTKLLGTKQEIALGKLRSGQIATAGAAAPATAPAAASSTAKGTVPQAMPKTGMGGAEATDNSGMMLWAAGALALAVAASVVVARRKAVQQ